MITVPNVGTFVGSFEEVLERSRVWRVDWCAGLDVPEYQDPEVAREAGMPDIPVPPGSLIFFSFLDDDQWLERTGICYERSLAIRRRIVMHKPLFVGDTVSGIARITDVECRERGDTLSVRVTIGTNYESGGELAVEEYVTYQTRNGRGVDA